MTCWACFDSSIKKNSVYEHRGKQIVEDEGPVTFMSVTKYNWNKDESYIKIIIAMMKKYYEIHNYMHTSTHIKQLVKTSASVDCLFS